METITLPQLENLLRHDTSALQQLRDLHDSGLVKTFGVAREDILRLVQKVEKENTNEEITAATGPVVNLRVAAASVLASRQSATASRQGPKPVGQRS